MKRLVSIFLIIILTCGYASANGKFIVVIDAGHGGKDAGAVRGKTKEKDINLAVALNLGQLIENSSKDVKVVYTRKTDVFVDLFKRGDIANKAKANLFISIHVNSTEAKSTNVTGVETFILGLNKSAENMRVAQRENEVILLEDNYKQKYENFDPKSPESYIIFEFMTNKYLDQSFEFASIVQSKAKSDAKRSDRGVKQGALIVLHQTASPSVLVELGFINNPSDEKYLTSSIGQRSIASSIFSAFKEYKQSFDKKQGGAIVRGEDADNRPAVAQQNQKVSSSSAATTTSKQVAEESPAARQTSSTVFVSKPKTDPVIVSAPAKAAPTKSEQVSQADVAPKAAPARVEKTLVVESVKKDEVEYRVQIMISQKLLPLEPSYFKGLSPIGYYKEGSTYKYTYGSAKDRKDAVLLQRKARALFSDAFIIEMKNGARIK